MATKKNPNAVALGKLGGEARAKKLSPEKRSVIARKAGLARNIKISPARRSQIAKLAVAARERKRKQRSTEKG